MENKKDYTIVTNSYALNIVQSMLKDINIENIPALSEDKILLREYVSTNIIMELSEDSSKFNAFFRAITGGTKDYSECDFNYIFGILNDFFESTGDKLISWKLMKGSELNDQENMDMLKVMEMMIQNPEMMKIFTTPTENTLES